jgi:hypothetical protein
VARSTSSKSSGEWQNPAVRSYMASVEMRHKPKVKVAVVGFVNFQFHSTHNCEQVNMKLQYNNFLLNVFSQLHSF